MIALLSTILAEHFWTIIVFIGIMIFGRTIHNKYIFEPVAGADGKVKMDELAKGIIMGILIWSVQRDGYRSHEWPFFSDVFYATLLAGIFAIAAIKPVTAVLHTRYNGKRSKQGEDDNTSSDASSESDSDIPNQELPKT